MTRAIVDAQSVLIVGKFEFMSSPDLNAPLFPTPFRTQLGGLIFAHAHGFTIVERPGKGMKQSSLKAVRRSRMRTRAVPGK
ncbi:MAG: hypothetical protein ABFS02_04440 [Pseudomonadota bacterium]